MIRMLPPFFIVLTVLVIPATIEFIVHCESLFFKFLRL